MKDAWLQKRLRIKANQPAYDPAYKEILQQLDQQFNEAYAKENYKKSVLVGMYIRKFVKL